MNLGTGGSSMEQLFSPEQLWLEDDYQWEPVRLTVQRKTKGALRFPSHTVIAACT